MERLVNVENKLRGNIVGGKVVGVVHRIDLVVERSEMGSMNEKASWPSGFVSEILKAGGGNPV